MKKFSCTSKPTNKEQLISYEISLKFTRERIIIVKIFCLEKIRIILVILRKIIFVGF